VRGSVTLAETQKVWAEPAAGCLVAAAPAVLERVGPGARLGIVVCGGNVTFADMVRWTNS
jgi:threonine dehydratase